jgi:hypothetical protein
MPHRGQETVIGVLRLWRWRDILRRTRPTRVYPYCARHVSRTYRLLTDKHISLEKRMHSFLTPIARQTSSNLRSRGFEIAQMLFHHRDSRCTTAIVRKITRDLNEDVCDRTRTLADTETLQQSRRERKKVEMRLAHMKTHSQVRLVSAAGFERRQGRSIANSNRVESKAARQASLSSPPPQAAAFPA